MKKFLKVFFIGVLFCMTSTELNANKVWGVNLTDKEQDFRYTLRKGLKKVHSFNVAPMTKSDGINTHGWSVSSVGGNAKNTNLTFIKYYKTTTNKGKTETFVKEIAVRESPYKSQELESLVAEKFNGKKPKKIIKNW